MPIVYVPVKLENDVRDKAQIECMDELSRAGWKFDGTIYLADSFDKKIKVAIMKKGW
jgi:hypothetical protein